jgi:prevent-host-death family protein
MQLTLYESKTQLSALVDRAAAGEEIVITKYGKPRARLVPLEKTTVSRPGLAKGKIWIAADFEAPLLGRLRLTAPFDVLLAADDFKELPLTLSHTVQLATMALRHPDPFDRALLAQARVERATLVTHDRALEPYRVSILWT